jgi:equilibrative nucleoside transporter 1/2/3
MVEKIEDGPKDPCRMVQAIFFWLGIGTLLPWNMFITVNAYWDHKFRNVTEESNGTILSEETEDIAAMWPGYLAVASMVPNVTFLILNGVFGHRFKTQPRLLASLILVIILFIFTSVMVQIDTDAWQSYFLYLTLASVVIININSAIFQGGILGVAGKFPPAYMGAVFSGQALGGIFASGTNVVVLALGATPTQAAFFCFVLSVIFLGTALVAYMVATRSDFYKHYLGEGDSQEKHDDHKLLETSPDHKPKLPVKVNPLSVMAQIWPYGLAVLLTFLVTLGCFPAITVRVQSTQTEGLWPTKFFIPVSCFLLFNVGDYLGRFLAGLIQWPRPGRVGAILTLTFSILRICFIPLFVICNAMPGNRSLTPVLLESDTAYIIIMLLFSTTNGYLGSICMMGAPQVVLSDEAQTAASLMVALLGLGLGSGAFLSNFFVKLL